MDLSQFRPRPALVRRVTTVEQPRFPVIDAHNHLGLFGGGWDTRPPEALRDAMDAADVRVYVDLDGGWGEDVLDHRLRTFKAVLGDRYLVFGGVQWDAWPQHGDTFGQWAAERLAAQVARGAQGLKIWKPLGLHVRDQRGDLVAVDDTRLDPLWAMAGTLRVPVMVHVADPVAFFDPLDATNERWDELGNHPEWHFPSPPFPPFLAILEAFARVVERHPQTTFIGAHVGCYSENLAWVSALLDRCPNLYVDPSARIGELGRQPYSARRFCIRHADRILFGTDAGPSLATYRRYFRFFETDDEYFNYSSDDDAPPTQGRWQIYGLYLPDDVLEKLYFRNAERVLGVRVTE